MRAWLKWDECNEWYQQNNHGHSLWFCKECPIEVTGDNDMLADGMCYGIRQDCDHAPRLTMRVPIRFISLEEMTNDW